jgi:hypothetical protein
MAVHIYTKLHMHKAAHAQNPPVRNRNWVRPSENPTCAKLAFSVWVVLFFFVICHTILVMCTVHLGYVSKFTDKAKSAL